MEFSEARGEYIAGCGGSPERDAPLFALAEFAQVPEDGRRGAGDFGASRESLLYDCACELKRLYLARDSRSHGPHANFSHGP